jgi:hypothetical protein
MNIDILNKRTDSESQGLSYLFIICWKNCFLKKTKLLMAYIDQRLLNLKKIKI